MGRYRYTKNAILFAVAAVVLLSSVSIVIADTSQPIEFKGTLQDQNGIDISAGAEVCAYIDGVERSNLTTVVDGWYGVTPPDSFVNLAVTGGPEDNGKTITFKVDGVQASPEFSISDWDTCASNSPHTRNLVVSGNIAYSDLEVTPLSGAAPLNVTANATVTNNGGSPESYTAPLKIDGAIVDWSNGTLAAGASTTVSFEYSLSEGTHSVGIASLTAVTVESGDSTPPAITDVVNSTPTTSSVAITWTTDDASDSRVKYGTVSGSGNYTLNVSDTTMATSHSITLEGLAASTKYYFVVNSTNVGAKSNESSEYNFTTASHPVPTITSFLPADGTISDIEGASRTFNITIDQTVNVTWRINGTVVQDANASVIVALYTNTSAAFGCWNVSAVANNTNGTDMQTWIWNVAETNATNVTGATNFTITSGDANVTGNFTGPLEGWVNVTDLGDDLTASPDVNDSTMTAGLGAGDTLFGGVHIDASQSIKDELAVNGSIRVELHYTDAELAALGITDKTTLEICKFNTTSSEWEVVKDQTYCKGNGSDPAANYLWVEITELCTIATKGSDTTPPVITNVANGTPTSDSVTIIWTTDEASDSLVKYGNVSGSDNYTASEPNTTMVTSHSITLTGLDSNTTYYFVVNSTDVAGNSNETAEDSFTTASATVDMINVTPAGPLTMNVTETQEFTATCYNDTIELTGITVEWDSSNTTVGTINSSGVFTAVANGTTTITATAQGVTSNAVSVTVGTTAVCTGDVTGDGYVNYDDVLYMVLNLWGSCTPGAEGDVNADGYVNYDDVLYMVLNLWGACP